MHAFVCIWYIAVCGTLVANVASCFPLRRGERKKKEQKKNRKRKLEDHGNSLGDRNVSSEFETSRMLCISFMRLRNGNFTSVIEVDSRESRG